jgi:GNAT superfamily N-acetyltransferase
MNAQTLHYEIRFDPKDSKKAVRYVTFGSFSAREFPLALWRMLWTREFVLYAGVPALIIILGKLISHLSAPLKKADIVFTIVAVVWMLLALFIISRFGKAHGIACYSAANHKGKGDLVGGFRMKVARRNRIMLAGVLVDPQHRKKGIFTALLLALFRIAQQEAQRERGSQGSPLKICIFAPGHPASRRVVRNYFENKQELVVDPGEDSAFTQNLKRLEQEVDSLEQNDITFSYSLTPLPMKN